MDQSLHTERDNFLKDHHSLQVQLANLQGERSTWQEKEATLQKEVQTLKSEILSLKVKLDSYLRKLFCSSKENFNPNQISLFNEAELESQTGEEKEDNRGEVRSHKRRKGRGKRQDFPKDMDREVHILDLEESEKHCSHCHGPLVEMGEEKTEKLKVIPARFVIKEERKKKYVCPSCKKGVLQARSPLTVLPKSIATPELISFVIFSKFYQGLPLYRQEALFALNKVGINRGTMARWLIEIGKMLKPIWHILQERVYESGYLAIDATRVQVLKEAGRKATSKSHMWAMGSEEKGIILFAYDISGGGQVVEYLLRGYEGAVQADGHGCYNVLKPKKVLLLGCMMHARRKFYNALVVQGEKQSGEALKQIQRIYKLESTYKEQGLTAEGRYKERQKEVRPLMEGSKELERGEIGKGWSK